MSTLRWRHHLDQGALRAIIVAGPVAAVLCSGLGGGLPPAWLVGGVFVLGLGTAWAPESATGSVTFVVVLGWWGSVDELVPLGVLPAATALLLAHLATLIAAYGAWDTPVSGDVLRTWAVRGLGLLAGVPLLWAAASALEGQPEPAGVWLIGGVAAAVAVVVATSGFDLHQGRRVE